MNIDYTTKVEVKFVSKNYVKHDIWIYNKYQIILGRSKPSNQKDIEGGRN